MEKDFEANAMVRAIREAHSRALRHATPEERLRFYREKAEHLRERMQGTTGEAK